MSSPEKRAEALAQGAVHFGMTAEGLREFCLPTYTGLDVWGQKIPKAERFKDFFRERKINPSTLTREDALAAERINRRLSAARRIRIEAETTRYTRTNMAKFTVTQESAVKLLVATGVKQAPNYNSKRLKQRISEYDQLPEEARAEVTDPILVKLQKQLMLALTKGDEIELVAAAAESPAEEEAPKKPSKADKKAKAEKPADPEEYDLTDEEEEEEEATKKPSKADKKAKAPKKVKEEDADDDDGDDEDDEAPKKAKAEKVRKVDPNKAGGRGVGINLVILDLLRAASKEKPITKEKMHSVLVKKFPERDPNSMRTTVNYYVPGYLTKGGYGIGSNDKGYWLAKDKKKK